MIDFSVLKTRLNRKQNIPLYIIAGLIILCFVISVFLYSTKNYGSKKIFIFPSVETGKQIVEFRYLRSESKSEQNLINYYIDEVLLGSGVERTKRIFSKGTKVESCFLQNGNLYLNLSGNLIALENDTIDIKTGMELLEKNIRMNFPKVKKIYFFVDGKSAFENQ